MGIKSYKKSDFKKGDSLYSIKKSQYNDNFQKKRHVIKKVGNKYIQVYDSDSRINIENLKFIEYGYTSWQVYKDVLDCHDEIRRLSLISEMYYWFVSTSKSENLTLEQLEKIEKILKEGESPNE